MLKKLLIAFAVALLVAGVGAPVSAQMSHSTSSQEPTQGQFENIAATEAATLIQQHQKDPNFAILDVRTPAEFAEGHLEHAINVDLQSPTFRDLLDILNKQKTYLVYCRSGRRTEQATRLMQDLHFSHVYNMTGGILEWTDKQLPVVK
jgi:rhodanese-related sulfurtransferase